METIRPALMDFTTYSRY